MARKHTSIRLSEEDQQRLEKKALETDSSVNTIVKTLIRDHLADFRITSKTEPERKAEGTRTAEPRARARRRASA